MTKCNMCKELVPDADIVSGMNIPYVTDGPVYTCRKCTPPLNEREIVEFIDNFINPIKELP